MIEFAPNLTGPWHIGSLRTYAVAYIHAKEKRLPLSIRFDADDPYTKIYQYDYHLISETLDILKKLNMSPDIVEHNTNVMVVSSVPSDLEIKRTPDGIADYCCIPTELNDKHLYYSYSLSECFDSSGNIIQNVKPSIKEEDLHSWVPGHYAFKLSHLDIWSIFSVFTRFLSMNLRGVSTITRGINLDYVNGSAEKYYVKYFNLKEISPLYTSIVFSQGGMLSKHNLQKKEYGTVQWAIDKYGVDYVRDTILESAKIPLPQPVLFMEDFL